MKTLHLAAIAALSMAGTAAHAGDRGQTLSFQIERQNIRIEVPKHCERLSCVQIAAPGLAKSFSLKDLSFNHSSDDDAADDSTPATNTTPATMAQAPQQTAAAQTTTAASTTSPAPATTTSAPALHDVVPGDPLPAAPPVAAAPPAPQPAPAAAVPAPAVAATTPIGIWRTEGGKGNVRIEPCGANLCGYAVSSGEKILISMRPEHSKWAGRIHDPNSGRNYDSTIAMKGPNLLRVQGCAFGGLFCGGQTWKRVS